ncbi:MAG: hypothetical protein AD742_17690 [Methylibium sp. NZG]|nr:MAG: hypothetical protein AD742_17690 [Methylibium sp. NZG]
MERRHALALLAAGWAGAAAANASTPPTAAAPPDRILLWIDLDLPALASLPAQQATERAALRARILAQQDAVMARLRELGATEEARLQQVRNALAVRLPGAALPAARSIPGVRRVSPVRHLRREPPSSRN